MVCWLVGRFDGGLVILIDWLITILKTIGLYVCTVCWCVCYLVDRIEMVGCIGRVRIGSILRLAHFLNWLIL